MLAIISSVAEVSGHTAHEKIARPLSKAYSGAMRESAQLRIAA